MIQQTNSAPTQGAQVTDTSDASTWARSKLDALVFRAAIDAAVALMWVDECAADMTPISRG